jgi:hypothetical protein
MSPSSFRGRAIAGLQRDRRNHGLWSFVIACFDQNLFIRLPNAFFAIVEIKMFLSGLVQLMTVSHCKQSER